VVVEEVGRGGGWTVAVWEAAGVVADGTAGVAGAGSAGRCGTAC